MIAKFCISCLASKLPCNPPLLAMILVYSHVSQCCKPKRYLKSNSSTHCHSTYDTKIFKQYLKCNNTYFKLNMYLWLWGHLLNRGPISTSKYFLSIYFTLLKDFLFPKHWTSILTFFHEHNSCEIKAVVKDGKVRNKTFVSKPCIMWENNTWSRKGVNQGNHQQTK